MRIALSGRNLEDVRPVLETFGARIVDTAPDVVVAHGGDGALLGAEREFPGIPKFAIRDRRSSPLCAEHSYEKLVEALVGDTLERTQLIKLVGEASGRQVVGMNDVFVHNSNPVSALRYRVWIDDEPYIHDVVGDGFGVATPHGSTAYYRSITSSIFRVGIGLAFNNSTEPVNHLVLPDTTVIRARITRGPAVLTADNNPEMIPVGEGDDVIIRIAECTAIVLGLDSFMCPVCRKLRHPSE